MASIKFYPQRNRPTKWRVHHRGKSYWLATEAEAKAKADALNKGGGAFTARELDEYRHAKELLAGIPLVTAVRHYMESLSGESGITVAELVSRHLSVATGRPDYLEKKRHYLGKLSKAVGDKLLAMVQPTDIESVVMGFRSDWVRNTFLTHARVLFRYGVRMKLTRNDPTAGMLERRVTPSKVILTLADTAHLLKTCREHFPDLVAPVALQLFTGIRTSEVCRLDWSAIKLGQFIDVSADVSKTHERRVIDWWPKRLSEYVSQAGAGSVVKVPKSYEAHKHQLVKLCRATKPDFIYGQNCPRHSFASYAVAFFQDAGKVALLMGQRDVNVLFRYYRDYRSQAEAREYFGEVSPT